MDGLEVGGSPGSHSTAAAAEESIDYRAIFAKSGNSIAAAARAIAQGLRSQPAKTLWMPEQYFDTQRLLHAYGVDSLVAVELRYWLARVISSDVSIFGIQGDRSIAALSLFIAKKGEYFGPDIP